MRPILLTISALVVLASADAFAAPKKKGAASAQQKKAPQPAAAPAAAPQGVPEQAASGEGAAPVRGPTRIDFDDRLIQGQTNKSGAVYLYDRKELKIRSMIKKRDNFRDEIIGSLYDS